MNTPGSQSPLLDDVFRKYLEDEDSTAFITAVFDRYTTGTLERLAGQGARVSRRAAVLALGYLSDIRSNAVLGAALHDEDRSVRLLAEQAIGQVWCRDGNAAQKRKLSAVIRLNDMGRHLQAARLAEELINEAPWFAEAWNQRAIAHFHARRYKESADDCHQTLELNPYHFGAASRLAQCYLELDDAYAALSGFRRALRLNPNLESVRAQIAFLERALEGK